MKKKVAIFGIIAMVIIVILGIWTLKKLSPSKSVSDDSIKDYEIANLKKSSIKIPEFSINVEGKFNGRITNEDIKDIDLHEFDASVKNENGVQINHYLGVRLEDVLNKMNFNDYEHINFSSYADTPISSSFTYEKNSINEKTYLIFYRDGKPIREYESVSVIFFDRNYNDSFENVISIAFD